ncbi:hypothetical protein ACSLWU_003751, partial [Salmonella enterica]
SAPMPNAPFSRPPAIGNAPTSDAHRVISPVSGLLLIRRVAGTAFLARFIVSPKPTFLKMQS